MKRSKLAAWVLVAVMAVSTAPAYVPANAAVKVRKVTVASSLSGDKKTVIVAKGKSVKLTTTVTVKPNKKANKKVSYSVKNKKIATVSKKGVVKGKKAGTTKITVTSVKNKKKKAVITVKVMKRAVTKVTCGSPNVALDVGQTATMNTTVTPGTGACKTLIYKTSANNVATVDKNGVITAVGEGTATITARTIDGSGKKATCNVTVAKPVSLVSLVSMNVLNARSVTFALDKPFPLNASQITVKQKMYMAGNYNHTSKISSMTTSDNRNYTMALDNDDYIGTGSMIRLEIPSLTGNVKSLEMEYKGQACAFTDEVVSAWKVDRYKTESFGFEMGNGYSTYAITAVPAGLTAEVEDDKVIVKGIPTTVGALDATLTAVDELGNTLTQTIHFIVGDDDTVMAAAPQSYSLIGTEAVTASQAVTATGGEYSGYDYSVISDPYGVVTNKAADGSLKDEYVKASFLVAGTYTVTVRAMSSYRSTQYADVNVVFHVKQGIVIGGSLKDAQGNVMTNGDVIFENNDRASLYCTSAEASYNYENSTYSAVVEPGVYDVTASHSFYPNAEASRDYTSSIKHLYAQSFMATSTGYDIQLDDIYKVDVLVPDYKGNIYWSQNGIYLASTTTIYLKNGTYSLRSDEIKDKDSAITTTTGDWFSGIVTTKTYPQPYRYTATFTVNGAAVSVTATKVLSDQPSVDVSKMPAAKNTYARIYDLNKMYSLKLDRDYYAYKFCPDETTSYSISNDNVHFYDLTTGDAIIADANGNYELEKGVEYLVGCGAYENYTFAISKGETTTTEP